MYDSMCEFVKNKVTLKYVFRQVSTIGHRELVLSDDLLYHICQIRLLEKVTKH